MATVPDGSARVLIVDDNVALAENIAEILELQGFVSFVAASAEDALPRALDDDVAVLVTDYRLPGIDGIELIKHIRRQRRQVRCFLISAYSDDSIVMSARDLGARFLGKPLDMQELVRFVSRREGNA